MPYARVVVGAFAVIAVAGSVRAQPDRPPDAGAKDERYVIPPGAEPLFADMLGSGQGLPGGCTFSDGRINGGSVLASYSCGSGPVVLEVLHPEVAPRGGVRTQRFAITVKSGAPPAGLVDAVADRIRAREATFEWKDLGARGTQRKRWWTPVAIGAVIVVLAFWALRGLARKGGRAG